MNNINFSSNRFAILENTVQEEFDQSQLNAFTTIVSRSNESSRNSISKNPNNPKQPNQPKSSSNSITKNKTEREGKVPPLTIYNVASKHIISFLKNAIKISEFKIKEISSNKLNLFLNSINAFERAKLFLIQSKVHFTTYIPKCFKKTSVLLKGLSADTDPEDILEAINNEADNDVHVTKVSPFSTRASIKKQISLPYFIVQVSADTNLAKLKNIKTILHRIVIWEALKKPEIKQCRNCQGFFHSAANCFLDPRCVKCNESHGAGKSKIQ